MDVTDALLDSWDRQSRIVNAVASRIDDSNRYLKPAPDSWPIGHHLAHMHKVRHFFLSNIDPERAASLGDSFVDGWDTPIADLDRIKSLLEASGIAVGEAVRDALKGGIKKVGWYDNPVLFLQHMVWHEGWHVGLIFLGLRLADQEPLEDWEEKHVWSEWRFEEY